jgi:iron(III) transport system permease protein
MLTSIALVAVVLAVVLLLGVGAGWLVAAYDFPGRAWLSWALVLPLSMPAFVLAYAYTDFLDTSGPLQTTLRALTGWSVRGYWFPDIRSLPGAGVCLGLALYPYVYMLARSAFAERSASLSDAARSLGLSPRATWWRVIWPVARPAVAAGSALVLMETLADFGTVSYFGIDTLTAGIYRSWQGMGDRVAAARLAIVLLLLVGGLAYAERRQRTRMRFHSRAARPAPAPATARCPSLARDRAGAGAGARGVRRARGSAAAGLVRRRAAGRRSGRAWLISTRCCWPRLATALILPVAVVTAYAARIVGGRSVRLAVALACAGYALPGVVIGVGLLVWVGMIDRWLGMMVLGGTIAAVVYAYGVRFFSIAYQGVESALARISPSMDQSARSLGAPPLEVLARVHWPLLRPSLAAAALLVVVDCLKELPATLVLRPFNFDTLAVAPITSPPTNDWPKRRCHRC